MLGFPQCHDRKERVDADAEWEPLQKLQHLNIAILDRIKCLLVCEELGYALRCSDDQHQLAVCILEGAARQVDLDRPNNEKVQLEAPEFRLINNDIIELLFDLFLDLIYLVPPLHVEHRD